MLDAVSSGRAGTQRPGAHDASRHLVEAGAGQAAPLAQQVLGVIGRQPVLMHNDAAREAYESVAAALQTEPGGICLIACHVWDTISAQAAGWQTGLILRLGNAPLDVGPQPDYIGDDLDEIADQLIGRYANGA
jgi:hypothetical protein